MQRERIHRRTELRRLWCALAHDARAPARMAGGLHHEPGLAGKARRAVMPGAAMGEVQAPFLAARVVADVHVLDLAVVGGIAARPAFQLRKDAGWVAAHVNGAADRMIAAMAARRDRADDRAAAGRDDAARFCGEHRRDAIERQRPPAPAATRRVTGVAFQTFDLGGAGLQVDGLEGVAGLEMLT